MNPAQPEKPPPIFEIGPHPNGEPYRFGDIIAADWLVALYLASDVKLIHRQPDGKAFLKDLDFGRGLPEDPTKNLVQAHADADDPMVIEVMGHARKTVRRAMILTDDCDIVKSNRILVAPVFTLPTNDQDKKHALLSTQAFGRFGVSEAEDPEGKGFYIDLTQTYTVAIESIEITTVALRPANAGVRQDLLIRWCAQAARHGPTVARDGATKLARLIEADGDAAEIERLNKKGVKPAVRFDDGTKPIANLLRAAWALEGPALDRIADDWEATQGPDRAIKQVTELLEDVETKAREARESLKAIAPVRPSEDAV